MTRMLSALALAGALLLPQAASSQSYPSRQITIVVTFPAGGNADTVARLLAEKLSQALGQPSSSRTSRAPPPSPAPAR